jgi:hypothetical protein
VRLAPTRARRATGSTVTPPIAVRSSSASSIAGTAEARWPVPCGTMRRPCSAASATASTTSSALRATTIAAGRWSAARFQARRASS